MNSPIDPSIHKTTVMKTTTSVLIAMLAWAANAQEKKPVNPAVLKAQRAFAAKKAEAAKGDPVAIYELGDLHYYGKGTGRNHGAAFKAYTQAAAKGYVLAEANLGWMYERGQGTGRDYKKALEWYTKAAEKGHAESQANLGEIYYNGKGLPKRDYVTAYKWYAIAAALGHREARGFAPKVQNLLRLPIVKPEEKAKVEQEVKDWLAKYSPPQAPPKTPPKK